MAIPWLIIVRCDMLYYVAMLCYAMLCYAMLCYAMLCDAMCYDMLDIYIAIESSKDH
jgi:hypothetical protein